MTSEEMASEALTLVMDTGLPRLAILLVALGRDDAAAACIDLQSKLLPVLRPSRRRRRSRQSK